MQRLGIVGGGAMGSAIISGLLAKQYLEPQQIVLVEPDSSKIRYFEERYHIQTKATYAEMAAVCDTIILALKPHIQPVVAEGLSLAVGTEHLLVSIAAGVPLQNLETWYPHSRLVRVMPNTPLQVGRGVSVFCPGRNATTEDIQEVAALFGNLGQVVQLPENQFDAATAVSGSGPAYVLYLVEAMIDAGVMLGLSRKDATLMATETFGGTIAMLQQTGEHPAKLRNDVTSPGGTTAAALFEFEKGAVSGIIMQALKAAALRSAELGKNSK
ncbi:MAG TPA: pyrroline-5-carboxylate reductase [Bacillota bacterium]|nr:pyrroline-5-carboxylate reductase [Bacillota bacterium]